MVDTIVDTLGAFVTVKEVERMNQKARVHTVRNARWIASSGLDGDKFDRASAFCAAIICNASSSRVSYHEAHHACGASTNKSNAPTNIPGVQRQKLHAIIKGYTTNMGTISTQVSRTVGASGIFTCMGIVEKSDRNGFTVLNTAHPFLIAFALELNKISTRQLIEMMEASE